MITTPSKLLQGNHSEDAQSESLSQALSRLIAEWLTCEQIDPARAAGIRKQIDLLADEIEIHADLAALAVQESDQRSLS